MILPMQRPGGPVIVCKSLQSPLTSDRLLIPLRSWEHSRGKVGPFGENLAAGTGLTAAAAVKMWTDEVCKCDSLAASYYTTHNLLTAEYNPARPQYSHFTQVVWKATTEVGCAVRPCTGILPGYPGVSTLIFYTNWRYWLPTIVRKACQFSCLRVSQAR